MQCALLVDLDVAGRSKVNGACWAHSDWVQAIAAGYGTSKERHGGASLPEMMSKLRGEICAADKRKNVGV